MAYVLGAPGPWPHNWVSCLCSHKQSHRQLQKQLRQLQSTASKALSKPGLRCALLKCSAFSCLGGFAFGAATPNPEDFKQIQTRPANTGKTISDYGHPARKVTDFFMALNVIVFALQWLSKDLLTFWGCKINSYIWAGQLWRLLTPALLHSNLIHLVVNTHALSVIGPHIEAISGHQRTLAIYVGSAFAANVASFLLSPSPSLGASGAVIGLGAALAVFYWRHRQTLGRVSERELKHLGTTVAINALYAFFMPRMDHWGHFGGMVGGALLAAALGPRIMRNQQGWLEDRPPVPWLASSAGSLTPAIVMVRQLGDKQASAAQSPQQSAGYREGSKDTKKERENRKGRNQKADEQS